MNAVFGIDLGTTNSVIARLDGGRPVAVPVAGQPIVPSVVLFLDGRTVVGREARNLALAHPEASVRSAKRKMGTDHRYAIGDRAIAPEDVSAAVLRELARGAEEATGLQVRDVVITVPAYFDDAQRRATLRAAELAGLEVLRLLNEPTAASLVYESALAGRIGADEFVLVYDLGGGTFDVSVIEVSGGVREVRATAGNTALGGDDFDDLLVERFLAGLAGGADLRGDAGAMARLARIAEETKIRLSAEPDVAVREEFLATREGQPVHLDTRVTRREFEDLIRGRIDETLALARQAIADAGLAAGQIRRVCLVGGSTRIPLVRAALEEELGAEVHEEIDADLAVGLGAAIQAGLLAGEPVDRILVDVAAHSLGMRVVGERDRLWREPDTFAPVLRRNTVLPAIRTEEFYTLCDGQEAIEVEVFQGERARCSENARVGSFRFELASVPASSPVHVAFAYDLNGIVKVSVSQPGHDNAKTVALAVADAGAAAQRQAEPVVIRKARSLLAGGALEPGARQELEGLVAAFTIAADAERPDAEDALLDFILAHEDAALAGAPA